jgi:hypothetical protein
VIIILIDEKLLVIFGEKIITFGGEALLIILVALIIKVENSV